MTDTTKAIKDALEADDAAYPHILTLNVGKYQIRYLLSRLEEAEREAERYRWLRDRSGTMKVGDCGEHDHRHFVMAGEFSSFLDQAIDAAMKEQSK